MMLRIEQYREAFVAIDGIPRFIFLIFERDETKIFLFINHF